MEQPFVVIDSSGRVRAVAVYNGEIYNARQLIEQLGGSDLPIISDGMALIPAYHAFGENLARHFDGEFALAIADVLRQKLILAVDPFGTKPLYWAKTEKDGRFAVASYSSVLLRLGFQSVDIKKVPPNTVSAPCIHPNVLVCNPIRSLSFVPLFSVVRLCVPAFIMYFVRSLCTCFFLSFVVSVCMSFVRSSFLYVFRYFVMLLCLLY